jgi:hypothetical protein
MTTAPSPSEQAPPEVMQAAQANGLGQLVRVFTRRKRPRLFGPAQVTSRIFDCEEGLVYQSVSDGKVHVYSWDKVVQMYLGSTRHYVNGGYTYTSYSSTVILSDGGKLSLTGMFTDPALSRRKRPTANDEHEIFMLMSAASKVVSQEQLPDAVARLERGEKLTFGDITISLAGVDTAKGLIPWNGIKDVQARQGVITIKQAGKFFPLSSQPVAKIPNAQLFFMLADALRRSQQR